MPKNSHFLTIFSKIAIKSTIFIFSKNPSVNTGGITWVISSNFQKNITIHVTPDFAPGARPINGIFKAAILDFGRPYWKFCQNFFFFEFGPGRTMNLPNIRFLNLKLRNFHFYTHVSPYLDLIPTHGNIT